MTDTKTIQTMDFNNIDTIKKAGFEGFKKMGELFIDDSVIPKVKGVYMVLIPDHSKPQFLQTGTGGRFKEKDPNVTTDKLQENWVDDSLVVYIGKAGSESGGATLHSRLQQYINFGQGKPVGHWGGRYIWQLKNAKDLLVCWKPLPDHEPAIVERSLIQAFTAQYSQRPFANLRN